MGGDCRNEDGSGKVGEVQDLGLLSLDAFVRERVGVSCDWLTDRRSGKALHELDTEITRRTIGGCLGGG